MANYCDLKEYIEVNYKGMINQSIEDFIDQRFDGSGFHSINVVSLCKSKPDNVKVMHVSCHSELADRIAIDVIVKCDIVTMGLGSKPYKADQKSVCITVHMHGELKDGLHDVSVYSVEEYFSRGFDKEGALDAFMIPYVFTEDLEDIADAFYEKYCKDAVYEGWRLPYSHIMMKMGVQSYEAPLPENIFGRMYFGKAKVKYWQYNCGLSKKLVEKEIAPGTMLINKDRFFMGNIGSTLNTIAHELIHWEYHQKFFEIIKLLNENAIELSCDVNPSKVNDSMAPLQKAVWWAEWQANTLTPRVLMPRVLFTKVFDSTYQEKIRYKAENPGQAMESTIDAVAELFGVSTYSVKNRAIQLGYDDADATQIRVNNRYYYPLSYKRGTLRDNETFIISKSELDEVCSKSEATESLFESGQFVYAGCVVCVNDPLYVEDDTDPYHVNEYKLTDYAKNRLDECCLKFKRSFISHSEFDYDYYGQCFLSRDVRSSNFCECKVIESENNQNTKEYAAELLKVDNESGRMAKILCNLPSSFSGTLNAHMNRIKKEDGKKITNLELSMRTGISDRRIQDLRKTEMKKKFSTVFALAIGLHLPPALSSDFVAKGGGYPMTKEGVFSRYLIENHYTESLILINEKLAERGYETWGETEVLC